MDLIKKKLAWLVLLCLALMVSAPVRASLIFSTEASFFSALGASYTETYASLPTTSTPSPNYSGNGFGYSVLSAASITSFGAIVPIGAGSFAVDPNALLGLTNELVITNISGGGVGAIGGYFYNASSGSAFDGGTVNLGFSDGTLHSVFSPFGGFPTYFGYVASSGTRLTSLVVLSPGGFPAIDRLTVGNVPFAVPEPGTALLLVAAALVGIGLGWRRTVRARKRDCAQLHAGVSRSAMMV